MYSANCGRTDNRVRSTEWKLKITDLKYEHIVNMKGVVSMPYGMEGDDDYIYPRALASINTESRRHIRCYQCCDVQKLFGV